MDTSHCPACGSPMVLELGDNYPEWMCVSCAEQPPLDLMGDADMQAEDDDLPF